MIHSVVKATFAFHFGLLFRFTGSDDSQMLEPIPQEKDNI